MPNTKRRLSPAERLRIAEELRSSGVDIHIPERWREKCRPFEILLADCTLLDRPGARPAYCIYGQVRLTRSGLMFPELELETGWDTPTLPDSFEEEEPVRGSRKCCALVQFAGHNYPKDEVLNLRMGQDFPAGRVISGYILAEGLHRLPAEFPDSGILPFDLILRDWLSGELIHRVQAELEVCRIRARECSVPPVREGLYGGKPQPLSPSEESALRYKEMLKTKPKWRWNERLSAQERDYHMLQYAALLHREKVAEALDRKEAKAQERAEMKALQELREQVSLAESASPQSLKQKRSGGTRRVEPAARGFGGDEASGSESGLEIPSGISFDANG